MKNVVTLIFVLLSFVKVNAQQWMPMGAQWTYMYKENISDPVPYLPTNWLADDTLTIKGKLCTIFHEASYSKPFDSVMIGYASKFKHDIMAVYQDSGRLYWFNAKNDLFTVLYDFNKIAGESWVITLNDCNATINVLSTSVDTINGFPLRTMTVNGGFAGGFSGKIIEFIGNLRSPRPMLPFSCSSPTDLTYEFDTLRCYQDFILGFYDFKTAPSCYYKLGIDAKKIFQNFVLYPNPSNDFFEINNTNTEKTTLKITDIVGKLVYQNVLPIGISQIDARQWAAGLYLYTIYQGNEIMSNGKLLKQ
mgnify:CR=1 FL=1